LNLSSQATIRGDEDQIGDEFSLKQNCKGHFAMSGTGQTYRILALLMLLPLAAPLAGQAAAPLANGADARSQSPSPVSRHIAFSAHQELHSAASPERILQIFQDPDL
jgi:hypothetical protein